MKIRRVVTGHGPDNKSGVAAIPWWTPSRLPLRRARNFSRCGVATTRPPSRMTARPVPFPRTSHPPAAFRFCVTTVPPERVRPEVPDIEAAVKEMEEKLPGMAARLDPNIPGMHSSETIDFIYVISGEIWMTLDDGTEVHLRAGETLVQNGTRHAWRNKGTEPCTFVICLIGTPRAHV